MAFTECERSPQAERAFCILHPIKALLNRRISALIGTRFGPRDHGLPFVNTYLSLGRRLTKPVSTVYLYGTREHSHRRSELARPEGLTAYFPLFYALLPVFRPRKSVVKSSVLMRLSLCLPFQSPPYTPRHRTSNGPPRLQGTSYYLSTIVLGGRTAGKRMRSCLAWDRAEERKCQTNIVGGRVDSRR
jgi:hypothetical protein